MIVISFRTSIVEVVKLLANNVEFTFRLDKEIIVDVVNVLTNRVENDPVYPVNVEFTFSVEFTVMVDKEIKVDVVRVLKNKVEKYPSFPFCVEFTSKVDEKIVKQRLESASKEEL